LSDVGYKFKKDESRANLTPLLGLFNNAANPIQEIIPVPFIPKDLRTLNPSGNNVMQSARGIYPGLARHDHHMAENS
jgi:hypothetical protein